LWKEVISKISKKIGSVLHDELKSTDEKIMIRNEIYLFSYCLKNQLFKSASNAIINILKDNYLQFSDNLIKNL
jgi:hypothetical protein